MEHAREKYEVSERHACRLLGQWRRTQRYAAIQRIDEDELTGTIIALTSEYGRYGYLIGGDGVKNAEPDFRGTILDSGEIKWEYYLPPTNSGGLFVFRHVRGKSSAFSVPILTIGRRSDPHGYFGVNTWPKDTGNQQFYPSGWQPVISYKFDKDKRTMTIIVPPQEADPQSISKSEPVTLTFKKASRAENEQVQPQ